MLLIDKNPEEKLIRNGHDRSIARFIAENPEIAEAARQEFIRAGYIKVDKTDRELRTGFQKAVYEAATRKDFEDISKEYKSNRAFQIYLDLCVKTAEEQLLQGVKEIPQNGYRKQFAETMTDLLAGTIAYFHVTGKRAELNGEMGELERSLTNVRDHTLFSEDSSREGAHLNELYERDMKIAISTMRKVFKEYDVEIPVYRGATLFKASMN